MMAAVNGTKVQNKPAAAGVTVPLSIVLVWIAGQLGLDVPPDVAAAAAGLLVTAAYVFTRSGEPAS
jgi:hypothetical protein